MSEHIYQRYNSLLKKLDFYSYKNVNIDGKNN